MSEDLEVRLVDALVDEIKNNAELSTPKSIVKYGRPVAVFPKDCPVLCVWLIGKAISPVTTNYVDGQISIGISWQVGAPDRVEQLKVNEERRRKTLKEMLSIQARMRWLHVHGFGATISECYELIPLGVDYLPPTSLETGLVEGYAMTVRADVQERDPT